MLQYIIIENKFTALTKCYSVLFKHFFEIQNGFTKLLTHTTCY